MTGRAFSLVAFLSWSLLATVTACQAQRASQNEPPDGRYSLKGDVVSVDKANRELVVKHEAIPGLMTAMTMPYEVKDEKDLDGLSRGDSISADVVVHRGTIWLDNVRVTSRPKALSLSLHPKI